MRYSIAAAALALGRAFGPAAFAAPGWGTQDNVAPRPLRKQEAGRPISDRWETTSYE
jgi:hypothetical protein